jgi:REP element-mobilizing transposase RayT
MPDHIHVLFSPNGDTGVVEFVRLLKGRLAAVLRRLGVTGCLWQRSFHDRALRREENLGEVIQYILHNPVRAGLAEDWRLYPFSGSPYMDR